MFTLEVENKQGAKLRLTQNESNYQIDNIEGLTPPTAELTTNIVANMHGERLKNSRLEMRELVLSIKINGEVEKNRIALYDFFNSGDYCKIYYKNGSRNVYCEGYCENFESELFEMNQTVQISVICPDPFWKSVTSTLVDVSNLFGVFEFPFAIDKNGIPFSDFINNRECIIINSGDVECGMIITLISEAEVENPVIYNVQTGESLTLNTILNVGDVITINTNRGQKSIRRITDGKEENIIHYMTNNSIFFQLKKGVNIFTYNALNNKFNLKVNFSYNNLYKGV